MRPGGSIYLAARTHTYTADPLSDYLFKLVSDVPAIVPDDQQFLSDRGLECFEELDEMKKSSVKRF